MQSRRLANSQFVRFLLVGLINTAFGYAVFAGFILLGAPTAFALAGGVVLGVMFNFRTIGRLVFGNRDLRLLPRFVGVYALYFLVNLASLDGLATLGLRPLLAQLLLLPWLSAFNFVLMRRLVFAPALGSRRDARSEARGSEAQHATFISTTDHADLGDDTRASLTRNAMPNIVCTATENT
jgi:putative flippase GtrA